MHRGPKKGDTNILRMDSNSATLKSPITAVSAKLNEFIKLTQKNVLTSRCISEDMEVPKIFAKVQPPCVKLNGKHDLWVPDPVRPSFHELR